MNTFYLVVYNILLLIFSPVLILYLIWALIISDHTRSGFFERIGIVKKSKVKGHERILIHAVSVGENVAEKPIWHELKKILPVGCEIMHSVTTDTGYKIAKKDFVAEGGDELVYFPVDFLPCVVLFLLTVRPKIIVLLETELWPNFLAFSKVFGIKVILANGRISDRSIRGGKLISPIYKWMTSNIDLYLMQSEIDGERIASLGADPERIVVVGNSKFDLVHYDKTDFSRKILREKYNISMFDKVIIAGSTHDTEEDIILAEYLVLKNTIPNLRLIIAPRDINRANTIKERAESFNLSIMLRTSISESVVPQSSDVIILNTIGELATLYLIADVAFIGGSFVSIGGHNVLEAAIFGIPVVFGPNMTNFRDIAEIVTANGVGKMALDKEDLRNFILDYLMTDITIDERQKMNKEIFGKYIGSSKKTARLTKMMFNI